MTLVKKIGKNAKHGISGSPIYEIWHCMVQRCNNSNNTAYKNYGARGITVCDKWLKFEGFYEDMGDRPEGMSLDRINNDGNYCKENCKWSTREEQNNNNRRNINITYEGKTQTLQQWANELNIGRDTLKHRLSKLKWSVKDAFETDLRNSNKGEK